MNSLCSLCTSVLLSLGLHSMCSHYQTVPVGLSHQSQVFVHAREALDPLCYISSPSLMLLLCDSLSLAWHKHTIFLNHQITLHTQLWKSLNTNQEENMNHVFLIWLWENGNLYCLSCFIFELLEQNSIKWNNWNVILRAMPAGSLWLSNLQISCLVRAQLLVCRLLLVVFLWWKWVVRLLLWSHFLTKVSPSITNHFPILYHFGD